MVGIDEVGRGSLAGPVVAAAVILSAPIDGLQDSKLLTRAERERLSLLIYENAEVGLGWVSHKIIDSHGLTYAVSKAMKQALAAIEVPFEDVIIDGNYNFLKRSRLISGKNVQLIIDADQSVPAVSAASIVAKVARDNFMIQIAKKYPRYSFEKHVGYGTKLHREMLKLYGHCQIHRQSYAPIKALSV